MSGSSKLVSAPFGTLLGVTDGDVEVFSCDYESLVGVNPFADRAQFQMFVGDTYTGFKWQCVELARRYLLKNYGVVFKSIPMAYDIFRLKVVSRVADDALLRMHSHKNGSSVRPGKGSLLMWEPLGEFNRTGHVAVIVDVADDHVDIVEQNVDDAVWPAGIKYSRRLSARVDPQTGAYTITCTFPDTAVLGWTTVAFDQIYTYEDLPNCTTSQIAQKTVTLTNEQAAQPYLDQSLPFVKVFSEEYGLLLGKPGKPYPYYTVTQTGQAGLEFATEELHRMFVDATDYVLHHEKEFGEHFRIPERLWPKMLRSFYSRKHDIVAGRFDFAITKDGLKVYEYNADSASCLLECGYTQDRWSEAAGIGGVGRSNSGELFDRLVATWKARNVVGPLHLLCDNDKEEIYHSMYMKAAAEAAGIECHLLIGMSAVTWTKDGDLQDGEKRLLQNVWKTWSWRTALNELSDEEFLLYLEKEEQFNEAKRSTPRSSSARPKLVDILLHLGIRIFEPLWTILPSSKAILPILWKMHPNHPYLLKSSFEITPEFLQNGYVAKPVTGRTGANVSLFGAQGGLIEKTEGKWDQDVAVYQELAMLPKFKDDFVQFCTWVVGGSYAGTILRVDRSGIIGLRSGTYSVRVVPDPQS